MSLTYACTTRRPRSFTRATHLDTWAPTSLPARPLSTARAGITSLGWAVSGIRRHVLGALASAFTAAGGTPGLGSHGGGLGGGRIRGSAHGGGRGSPRWWWYAHSSHI